MKYNFISANISHWLYSKQLLLLVTGSFSIFIVYYLTQTTRSYDIINKLLPQPSHAIAPIKAKPKRKLKPSIYTQKSFQANTAFIDDQDPFDVYIMSTYYYPTSESLGNNGVALALVPPVRWMYAVNNTIIVRASNRRESKTTSCTVERTNHGGWCALHSAFAGCRGVPNMTKFEISLGNDTFHEIPFKTVSYEKKDVVTCIAPLFAAEQWHQIIFAAHIYRKYGTFMHLYIRSVVAPVYELIRVYEREGYLKAEPYPRIKYSSVPEYMFNPNRQVSFRAQESAQTDCLLQYKESAQYIMFVDLDDVLIPREAPTYLEEFNIYIHQAEYIFYRKANVYYEANNDPQKFSVFDIFHSARFLDVIETGKIAVVPKYVNHTMIHMVENNRNHSGSWPMNWQNVIVHLKKAYPLGYADKPKQLWPYFYRNDTTIFNETDTATIEEDYKRISSKYPEIWKDLPNSLTYYPIILKCFDSKYYQYWYADDEARNQIKWCMNPDYCKIPPKLIAPCANAAADYFSSEDGTTINVHYPKNHRFSIQDRCIT